MSKSILYFSLVVAILLLFTATTNNAYASDPTDHSYINKVIDMLTMINVSLSYLYGGNYLVGSLVLWTKKKWLFGLGMLLLFPATFFYGAMVYPALTVLIVNISIASGSMALGTGLFVLWNLFALFCFAVMGFLPSIIASKRKVVKSRLIFGCNFLGFLPLAWPILLHFSLNEKKNLVK